jgi:hypothetical protein
MRDEPVFDDARHDAIPGQFASSEEAGRTGADNQHLLPLRVDSRHCPTLLARMIVRLAHPRDKRWNVEQDHRRDQPVLLVTERLPGATIADQGAAARGHITDLSDENDPLPTAATRSNPVAHTGTDTLFKRAVDQSKIARKHIRTCKTFALDTH